jgi:hypothetical protein
MPAAATGDCDLLISPVLPLDAGQYVCQAGGRQTEPARLQVNVQPGQPHILEARDEGRLQVEAGERLELSCQSQGGRPFAELQWRDGKGRRLVGEDVEEHVTRIEDTSMFRTLSKLKMSVEAAMSVTCTAHSEAFPELRESAPLEVTLAGEPELEVVRVCEGQTFKLECADEADDLTEELSYKWLIDDKEVEGEEEETLKMIDFTASFDRSTVQCMVTDGAGQSRVARRFQLEHSPVPTPGPSPAARRLTGRRGEGRRTVVTCVVEGEEGDGGEPEFVWVSGKLERAGTTMVGEDGQDRRYRCRVRPGGHGKLTKMAGKIKEITKTTKQIARHMNKMTAHVDDL